MGTKRSLYPLTFDSAKQQISPKHILATTGYPTYYFKWVEVEKGVYASRAKYPQKREQVFLQNRRQVAAQEQLRIKKVATNGERSAI